MERVVVDYDSLDEVLLIINEASKKLDKVSLNLTNCSVSNIVNEENMETLVAELNSFYNSVHGSDEQIKELLSNEAVITYEDEERGIQLIDDFAVDNSDYDPAFFVETCQTLIDEIDEQIKVKEKAYEETFGDNSSSIFDFRLTYESSLEIYENCINNILMSLESMLPIECINQYLKDEFNEEAITYYDLMELYRQGFYEGDEEAKLKFDEIMRGGFTKLNEISEFYTPDTIDFLMETEITYRFEAFVENQMEIDNVLKPAVDAAIEIAKLKDSKRQMELYSYSYILELDEVKNYTSSDLSNKLSEDELHFLSMEEASIYTYLLNNNREQDANHFLELMEDTINQRKGLEGAFNFARNITKNDNDFLYDYVSSSLEGNWNGLINFGNGFVNLFSPDGKVSASEYEQQYIIMLLSQQYDMDAIKEQYAVDSEEYLIYQKMSEISYNEVLSFGYQIGVSVGNMLPSIAVSWIPVVGKPLAMGGMLLSSTGNSVEAAYQRGTTGFKAYLYGSLMGVSEVSMEYLLGGIPGLSQASGFTLKAILGEGLEEAVQVLVETGGNYAFFGEEINWAELPEKELSAFAMGTFMSFCLNGGTTTINLGVKGTKVLTTSEIENFMSTDSSGNVSFDAKAFGNYLAGIKALGDGNSSKAVQYFEKSNMLGKLNSTELQTLISNLTGLDLENFNLKYQDVNGNYDFANGGVLTTGMASAKLGENSFKGIVDLLSEYGKQKYGLDNYGITVLSEYLKTGNSGSITRQNNLRTIVESIDKKELASFLDNYTRNFNSFNIQSCVSQLDAYGLARDWGSNYGRTALKEYLTTGNVCVITSQGNLRNIVSSIAPNDLLQMYNRYFGDNLQINNKSSVLSLGSINLNSNNITLVNDYYNEFFKFNGNLDDATFGVDQAAIEKLCDYYIDGQKMSYYSAMKIINECKKQGKPLPKVKKIGSDEYFRLKDKLVSMGFSPSDASVIMSTVNYAGACSYASVANEIFCSFSRNPVLFKQKFGYDMYTIDANGNKTLNSAELLLDMYVHCNMKKNGGGFIEKSMFSNRYSLNNKYLTGEIDVFGRSMLDAGNQVYLSTIPGGKRVTPINSFLQAHGLSYSSECIYYNKPNSKLDDYQMNSIIDEINRRIQSGSVVSMDISSRGREIRMVSTNQDIYNSESTWTWKEGGAHSIYVTGIANDGFVVSSWGREYIIPFSDLKNGGSFQITLSAVYNNK